MINIAMNTPKKMPFYFIINIINLGYLRKKLIKFELLILLVCSSVIISCYPYRDLENFLEFEKTDAVSYNMTKTIIYHKINRPDDESYLIIKKPSEERENIIFQGHPGHIIDKLFVDKENQRLVYSLRDARKDSYYYYLIFYDLKTMKIINKISVMDTISKSKKEDFGYDNIYLPFWIQIDEINKKILFPIRYKAIWHGTSITRNDRRDYIVFDIDTGLAEEIFIEEGKKISDYFQISKRASTYFHQNNKKELFFITSETKYQTQYYKRDYYGIYINDGKHNIRISKSYNIGGSSNLFWLDDGQYIICGSYILDTSGKLRKTKIVDGEILAIY
ncbi:MAG: hypothetical protein LBQ93_08840 [Treponema sp.]|jgi:hypothetical protein|nr:hypothetical protein [Treponema sp.]